jgi:hypothetical protein
MGVKLVTPHGAVNAARDHDWVRALANRKQSAEYGSSGAGGKIGQKRC